MYLIVLKHPIGKGKRGVWFTAVDLELLELLWEFNYLSLYQIKYYCKRLYGIEPKVIERKFQRWRDCKIVLSDDYTKPPAAKIYYRMGPEGFDVLERIGKIHGHDKSILGDLSKKRNFDHFFAVRDVALLSIINMKRNKKDIGSLSPFKRPYMEDPEKDTVPLLVPDWILCNQYGFLNIELDTGSEYLNKLNDKITKYVRYASLRSNEIHHVLLVVIDENDTALKYTSKMSKDRSGRIANLKDAVINLNAHIYPNLHFYVVSMSRAGEVAYQILSGNYPYSNDARAEECFTAISGLELSNTFKNAIEPMNPDDFYLAEVNESLYADGHYLFKSEDGSVSEVVLMKIMEEGSVKSLDIIQYLDLLKSENRFKQKVDKILGIYHLKEELENDVLGKVLTNVHFSSTVNLYEDKPTFYQTVNTARKEDVLLYER